MTLSSSRLPWATLGDLDFPLILAPMAGLSHGAFRRLVEEIAPFDLYFTEMISAGPLTSRGRFEDYYLDPYPGPRRLVYQLVSPRRDLLLSAAGRLADLGPAGIDVNFGCSAPEIVRAGGGIAWLAKPREALNALAELSAAIDPIPLSVKLRLPEGSTEEEVVDFLQELPETGVAAVTIHPRYQKQSYGRPAHRALFRRLAAASPLPVVASGDITDRDSLAAYREMPGVSGAMIGRGAVAHPWIAAELRAEIRSGRPCGPLGTGGKRRQEPQTRLEVSERFFELLEEHQPREFWISRTRRFLSYYLGAVPFGRRVAAQAQEDRDYHAMKDRALSFLGRRLEMVG